MQKGSLQSTALDCRLSLYMGRVQVKSDEIIAAIS